jgi:hypothetical protein
LASNGAGGIPAAALVAGVLERAGRAVQARGVPVADEGAGEAAVARLALERLRRAVRVRLDGTQTFILSINYTHLCTPTP